jgi:hypothetical protein
MNGIKHHLPTSKKRKSTSGALRIADVVVDGDEFLKVDMRAL